RSRPVPGASGRRAGIETPVRPADRRDGRSGPAAGAGLSGSPGGAGDLVSMTAFVLVVAAVQAVVVAVVVDAHDFPFDDDFLGHHLGFPGAAGGDGRARGAAQCTADDRAVTA